MTDRIKITLRDLVMHHKCQADAWQMSGDDNMTQVQIDMIGKMTDYHLAAAELLTKLEDVQNANYPKN